MYGRCLLKRKGTPWSCLPSGPPEFQSSRNCENPGGTAWGAICPLPESTTGSATTAKAIPRGGCYIKIPSSHTLCIASSLCQSRQDALGDDPPEGRREGDHRRGEGGTWVRWDQGGGVPRGPNAWT